MMEAYIRSSVLIERCLEKLGENKMKTEKEEKEKERRELLELGEKIKWEVRELEMTGRVIEDIEYKNSSQHRNSKHWRHMRGVSRVHKRLRELRVGELVRKVEERRVGEGERSLVIECLRSVSLFLLHALSSLPPAFSSLLQLLNQTYFMGYGVVMMSSVGRTWRVMKNMRREVEGLVGYLSTLPLSLPSPSPPFSPPSSLPLPPSPLSSSPSPKRKRSSLSTPLPTPPQLPHQQLSIFQLLTSTHLSPNPPDYSHKKRRTTHSN